MVRYALVISLVCACTKGQGQEVVVPAPVVSVVPPDRDGDGVADDRDACPDEQGPDGCPLPDTDGDGILDQDDKCPTLPETTNGYLDEDGCADEFPTQLAKFTGTIKGIYFEEGKATIKPRSGPVLDHAVALLREFPEIRVEISGHTDAREKSPEQLALRRAQAVHDYLVEQGVDAGRLELRGAAAEEAIDTNKTPAGRAKNRRIEFTILVR